MPLERGVSKNMPTVAHVSSGSSPVRRGLYRRVFSGTLANIAGIGLTSALQFATIPILASVWGSSELGVWMMLTTIPTYFALTDLGFLQAATSEMAMSHAVGDDKRTCAVFQSTCALIVIVCSCAVAAIWMVVLLLGAAGVTGITRYETVIGLLGVLAGMGLMSRLPVAAMRATGHYAVATVAFDGMSVLEGAAGLLTAWLGGGFEAVVLCQIVWRMINLGAMYLLMRVKTPFLSAGWSHVRRDTIRRLAGPAIGAMTIPVALAMNLQGVVLIVGFLLGPVAVAVYTPVRTASRLVIQAISVVNRATMPELSAATSRTDRPCQHRLVRINLVLVLGILCPGFVLFGLFGRDFVIFWSAGHIVPDRSFVVLMSIASFLNGCWYFAANLLLATNAHVAIAKYIFMAALVTLVATLLLGSIAGLNGAAVALAVGECICLVSVSREFSRRYLIKR